MTKLYDLNFHREKNLTTLREYDVLYLAIHNAFLPSQPEDSFILIGNGRQYQFKIQYSETA